jgi:MYXO-CTERM domain-containing protein
MRCKVMAFSLVMSIALEASARETYPAGIQEAANIPCTPTCVLCHAAVPGTRTNLTQPFGVAVRLNDAFVVGDPSSLHAVVADLRAKQVDSDGDGKIDVDELAAGTNPNDPAPLAELCAPLYGCGAHLAPPPPPERAPVMWWLVGLLALTAAVALRRLRRVG